MKHVQNFVLYLKFIQQMNEIKRKKGGPLFHESGFHTAVE